jgi:hypothetical protein
MFSTSIRRTGVFRLHEKADKDGQPSLVAFKKTGPNSSLRIILRRNSPGYELCKKGEWWLIEYFEDDAQGFAWAEPMERVKLKSEFLITNNDGKTIVGKRYTLECESVEYSKVVMDAKMPSTRTMNEFMISLLNAKIKSCKLTAYTDEIFADFERGIFELVNLEKTALKLIDETVEYLEMADDALEEKETRVISKQNMKIKLRGLINPYTEEIPNRDALCSEALEEFKILQFNKELNAFIVEK